MCGWIFIPPRYIRMDAHGTIRKADRWRGFKSSFFIAIRHIVGYNIQEQYSVLKRGVIMLAVNYTTMRNNLKNVLDKVSDDCETVIITRKEEKNVVIMSLEQYNNLMENDFIVGNKKYYTRLLESKRQIEQGRTVLKTTEELETLADE